MNKNIVKILLLTAMVGNSILGREDSNSKDNNQCIILEKGCIFYHYIIFSNNVKDEKIVKNQFMIVEPFKDVVHVSLLDQIRQFNSYSTTKQNWIEKSLCPSKLVWAPGQCSKKKFNDKKGPGGEIC